MNLTSWCTPVQKAPCHVEKVVQERGRMLYARAIRRQVIVERVL